MKLLLSLIISFQFLTSAWAIIDGQEVDPAKYPAVFHYEIFSPKGMSFCTGTFVSSNTILTAAHCLIDHTFQNKVKKGVEILLPEREMQIKEILISDVFARQRKDISMRLFGTGLDLAFIILDKPVYRGKTIKIAMETNLHDPILLLGYGGSLLKTVHEQDKNADPTAGILRSGTSALETIHRYGRLDSKKQNYSPSLLSLFTTKPRMAMSSRGDSGGPVLQKGKIIGVIAGTDASSQTNEDVRSLTTYMAGTYSEHFKGLVQLLISRGGSVL